MPAFQVAPPEFDVLRGERWIARAPGRFDLMGGIADYCGSLVLEMPLRASAWVALQFIAEPEIEACHARPPQGFAESVHLPLADWAPAGALAEPADLRARLVSTPGALWSAYLLGVLHQMLEQGWVAPLKGGLRLTLLSDVPWGAGVSSSAALEVAALQALCEAFGVEKDGVAKAMLAQAAENKVVGAPCGVMDQATALMGRQNQLLALECRPCEVKGWVPLPKACAVFGLNTGVKHRVAGAQYVRVRTAARMGQRILAKRVGFIDHLAGDGGALLFERVGKDLPRSVRGADFLRDYGDLDDPSVEVEAGQDYAVRACVEHHTGEGSRVPVFARLLEAAARSSGRARSGALIDAGKLMAESHLSYGSNCGLGCDEASLLVGWLRELGPEQGVYGAKISGGGGGGTVVVLAEQGAQGALGEVARRYAEKTGLAGGLITGSGPGALETPPIHLEA